jgi:PAS domain S-box-containing protein
MTASLAETLSGVDSQQEIAVMSRQLGQMLAGVPFVRALAVVDANGRILACSSDKDNGRQIDLKRIGVKPAKGTSLLGPLTRGRDFADLDVEVVPDSLRAGVNLLPFMHSFALKSGPSLMVIALINPDSYVTFQRQAVADGGISVRLLSFTGQIITSTLDMSRAPSLSLADHSLFTGHHVALEHGTYMDRPYGADESVVGFRASRSWPFVVLVEQPYAATTQRWLARMRPVMIGGGLVVMLLLGMSVVLYRSLRSRERSRVMFDHARDQVVRSERELSVLLRSLQELIFRTDASGVITYVNTRWAALLGRDANFALGQSFLDVLTPEEPAGRQRLFALGETDGVRHCRAHAGAGNGQVRHFEVAVVPLLVDNQITAFAGSAVDITELLESQKKLQMQLNLIGLMLEISPQPTSMSDDAGRIVMVNKAWEQFKGMTRLDVVGKGLYEILPHAEALLHERGELQLARQGGEVRFEARTLRFDHTPRDTMISKVMVPNESGSLQGVLTVLIDVTEFREAERAIREARDVAEEASRSKSEFVANISHELRTPLQSIIGFSELGMVRGVGSERISGMFQDINASGQRMLALVNDLLDVSKIESTVGTFHLESIDLRGLIRVVVREMEPLLARKKLKLSVDCSELPLLARADPLRFQQVIRNVLANTIKFSPIEEKVLLTAHMGASWIEIRVRDFGPGIPESELEKIFEAFVQSSKTKDGAGGTGLGLAICRKIVEGHGGQIFASNMKDGGAVFQINFPPRTGPATGPMPLM